MAAPQITGGTVPVAGTSVILILSRPVTSAGLASDWTVQGGVSHPVTAAVLTNPTHITLSLGDTIFAGENISYSYTGTAVRAVDDGSLLGAISNGGAGSTGPTGAAGTPGSQWRTGTSVPSNSLGTDGDFYLRLTTGAGNGNVYERISGAYVLEGNIAGTGGGSAAYHDAVLADAPLLWYRLGDAPGASVMADSGSLAVNGTFAGSPTLGATGLITGDTDTAAVFNGSGQYGAASSTGCPAGSAARTVEAWGKFTSTGGAICSIGDGTGQYFTCQLDLSGGNAYLFSDGVNAGNNVFITASSAPAAGSLFHYACTFDGSGGYAIYLNGALAASGTFSVSISTAGTDVHVARRPDVLSVDFAGALDEVAIYGTALSGTRVSAHYAAGL